MCGRFTQKYTWREVHEFLNLIQPARNIEPRYNIAPTTEVWTALHSDDGRELVAMRWGLIPSWWKKSSKEIPATFNARAEGIEKKPMFRSAFKSRRCLVPASGFYEWKKIGDGKQPYYITSADGPILVFAGLWETWKDTESGDEIRSCTIVTTEPNDKMAELHNRMPVILGQDTWDAWLSVEAGSEILTPCPSAWLQMWPVNKRVGNVRNDEPELVEAVG